MELLFNRIVLLAVFSFLFLPAAKAQSFVWAQAINGINPDRGTSVGSVATDTTGNTYSIGGFGSTVDFGSGVSLTAVSQVDMFIMKKDPLGSLIWVKLVKGLSSGVGGCGGVGAVDSAGNILIVGGFRDSFDFDPGPAVYKLSSNGNYHVFILKLDSAGNFISVKDIGYQFPAISIIMGNLKRGKNGYIYFALQIRGDGITPLDVDPGPGVYNITPNLGDLLLQKLDSNGNFVWAKLISGDKAKQPWGLGLDSNSNVFVSGSLWGSADFDPGPGVYTLTNSSPNYPDVFVAKYDSVGNFNWAKSIGGNSYDIGTGGTVDRFGNVLVTGAFGGTVDFDPGPGAYNLTSLSTRNIFTLKLRNNGDFAWARRMGSGGGLHEGRAITTDNSGNVYTAAYSPGGCDLDPGPAVHAVGGDCIVQKLDSMGNYLWGAGWEGQTPGWIGLDNKDSVYITGIFSGFNKDFDPGPGVYALSGVSANVFSGFILKLNQMLLPTGVEDAGLHPAAVSVYPNPSSGVITFSAPSAIQRIVVTDLTGKVVYQSQPVSLQATIDLGGKAAGIYFYEVESGPGKQRGKLVIH